MADSAGQTSLTTENTNSVFETKKFNTLLPSKKNEIKEYQSAVTPILSSPKNEKVETPSEKIEQDLNIII